MKKIVLNQKLQLRKETIANLNKGEMNSILGGGHPTNSCQCVKNSDTPINVNQTLACQTIKHTI